MDKVVYVGRILTLEEPLYAEAMLVEDGVISALGSKKEVLEQAGKQAQVVELGNNVLMPAFIDAHSHFAACANGMFQVPLEEGARIVDQAKNMQNGQGKCVRYCMSNRQGKVEILGTLQNGEMLFKFHQAKDPKDAARIFTRKLQPGQAWVEA